MFAVSGKSPAKPGNSNGFNNSRTNSRSQSMVRCSSMGVLNRMDQGAEIQSSDNKKFKVGKGLMRPTISSQNKIANSGAKIQNLALTKRRATAFSSGKLAFFFINSHSVRYQCHAMSLKYGVACLYPHFFAFCCSQVVSSC